MRSCQYWVLYFPSSEQTHCPLHWFGYSELANDLVLCIYSFLHCQSVKSFLKGSMSSVLHKQSPFWWLHLQLDLSERVSSFPLLCLSLSQPGCLWESVRHITGSNPALRGLPWVAAACIKGNFCRHCAGSQIITSLLHWAFVPPLACSGGELTRGVLSTWKPTTKQRISWRSAMQRTSWLSLLRLSVPPPPTVSS